MTEYEFTSEELEMLDKALMAVPFLLRAMAMARLAGTDHPVTTPSP